MTPKEIRHKLLTPEFPVEKLTALLDHDNLQMRADFRLLLFISIYILVLLQLSEKICASIYHILKLLFLTHQYLFPLLITYSAYLLN